MQNFQEYVSKKKELIVETETNITTFEGKVAKANTDLKTSYAALTFTEKYIPWILFFLGLDTTSVVAYKGQKSDRNTLIEQLENLKETLVFHRNQLNVSVETHLKKNDSRYQNLLLPYQAATEVNTAVEKYLTEIEEALSSVSSAQSTETLDLFSSNKGVSCMSMAANSSASSEIGDVQDSTAEFLAAIKKYNGFIKTYTIPAVVSNIDDISDTIFDFAFDGFDFLSLCTLSALSDAQDDLETVQLEVEKIQAVVAGNLQSAEQALKKYKESFIASIA